MLIPILMEPIFCDSNWAKQTMKGVSSEASRRKYRLHLLAEEDYRTTDYDALFRNEKRMIIIIGTSFTWMPGVLSFFHEKNISPVLIHFDPRETITLRGVVRIDYVSAMFTLIDYMNSCGHDRIALYAFNPNASSDSIKLKTFQDWQERNDPQKKCGLIINYGILDQCYAEFRSRMDRYSAVICANDIVTVSLMRHLKEDGIRVPEDLYVASFGDSVLAQSVHPAITSCTLDQEEMGRQAVALFSFLSRQDPATNVSLRVKSKLIIRESTANCPYKPTDLHKSLGAMVERVNFYGDLETHRLMAAETILTACDEADHALLHCMLHGEPIESLESRYYLTASALQYRRKRLMALADCTTKQEMQEFLLFCKDSDLIV